MHRRRRYRRGAFEAKWRLNDDASNPLTVSPAAAAATPTAQDNAFDEIVGALEMVLLDPGVVELQRGFCEAHCSEFEDSDENKLSYTGIFEQYQNTVESYIQKRVGEVIDGFSLEAFGEMLTTRQGASICMAQRFPSASS